MTTPRTDAADKKALMWAFREAPFQFVNRGRLGGIYSLLP